MTFLVQKIAPYRLPLSNRLQVLYKHATFKIKGSFVKRFIPYQLDKIIKTDEKFLIIDSKYLNSEELLSRLMKYGDNCEIFAPKLGLVYGEK